MKKGILSKFKKQKGIINPIENHFKKKLGEYYPKLNQTENKDIVGALTIDKPVYKETEEVKINLFLYNKYTKKPLQNKIRDNINIKIDVLDGNGNKIKELKIKEKNFSLFNFSFFIEKGFKGGYYKLVTRGIDMEENIKFFVMQFQNKKNFLFVDWNKDVIYPKDKIFAKVSIKTFTGENLIDSKINFEYKFIDINQNVMLEAKKIIENNSSSIYFKIPEDIVKGNIICELKADLNGEILYSSKQFEFASLDKIKSRFVFQGGVHVYDFVNKIYFEFFSDDSEGNFLEINRAKLIEVSSKGTRKVLDQRISSLVNGKGSFKLMIKNKYSYFLSVCINNLEREFIILDSTDTAKGILKSDVKLNCDKTILENDDKINIEIISKNSNNVFLVLMDKFHIYFEKTLEINQEEKLLIDLSEYNLNGGIYSLAVMKNEKKTEKKIGMKTKMKIIQEILIFVKCSEIIEHNLKFDKEVYCPEDEVILEITKNKKSYSTIIVTDESAFLEIEGRKMPPSFISKIYLEKDLYFKSNEFLECYEYIDHYFSNLKSKDEKLSFDKLEIILGLQSWRLCQMNLDVRSINKIEKNEKILKNKFQYLLPGKINDIKNKISPPKPMLKWRMMKGAGRGVGGMVFAKMGVKKCIKKSKKNFLFKKQPEKKKDIKNKKSKRSSKIVEDDCDLEVEEKKIEKEELSTGNPEEKINIQELIKKDNVFYISLSKNTEKITESFKLPNNVSKFRVYIISFTKNGIYGINSSEIKSEKKFQVDMNIPLYLYKNEGMKLNLNLRNNYNEKRKINITMEKSQNINVDKKAKLIYPLDINYKNLPINLKVNMENNPDTELIKINPQKLGYTIIRGSKLLTLEENKNIDETNLELPKDYINNTLKVKVYQQVMGPNLILKGLNRLIKEPCGCFEQTSSTTFPMVILLHYLNTQEETEKISKMRLKIEPKLKKGIKRLLSYECKNGGFEWFGNEPGHVTLTAYGIWQFQEILNLGSDYLDEDVITRSIKWLKEKCKKGVYKIGKGYDRFGKSPQLLSDVYILFVMSVLEDNDIDLKHDIIFKIQEYEKNPKNFTDSYYLAFIGLIYFNFGEKEKANQIADILKNNQKKKIGNILFCKTSITNSLGKSLEVETTSLSLMLFIKFGSKYSKEIQGCVNFLSKNSTGGYFHSSQGTVLALKALTEYIKVNTNSSDDLSINVKVNKHLKKLETKNSDKEKVIEELTYNIDENYLDDNKNINFYVKNNLEVKKGKIKIEFNYEYETSSPKNSLNSPLNFKVNKIENDNTINYNVILENKEKKVQGMVIAILKKDSDCLLNLNDLENLRITKKIDFFEMRNNNSEIIFYWRGMGVNEIKDINISLTKNFEIENKMKLYHSAYLYYGKEETIVYSST